jgi:hypothetical protein
MITKSPHPDVTLPDGPLTASILAKADQFGDRPAVIDGPPGRTIAFAKLKQSLPSPPAGRRRA